MTKFLVACAVAWPCVLGAATVARSQHAAPWLTATTYLVAGRVCHQRPERSFHTAGAQWPVCARCSGLYLAAPFGAVAALWLGKRERRPSLGWLAAFGAPTVLTFAAEHLGLAPFTNPIRFAAALPLGAAVAWVIVRTVNLRSIE